MAVRKSQSLLDRDTIEATDANLEPTPTPIPTPIAPGIRVRQCVTNHRADDALSVPTFGDAEFHPGERIMETVNALRRSCQELTAIEDYKIVAFWTAKGIKVAGKEQYGRALKPGGRQRYLTGGADFIIDMSAEVCRGLANYEFEAAVYHQLKHCAEIEGETIDGDTTRRAGTVGHDFEGFIDEVNRYGFWNTDLREAIEPYQAQLKLDLKV